MPPPALPPERPTAGPGSFPGSAPRHLHPLRPHDCEGWRRRQAFGDLHRSGRLHGGVDPIRHREVASNA